MSHYLRRKEGVRWKAVSVSIFYNLLLEVCIIQTTGSVLFILCSFNKKLSPTLGQRVINMKSLEREDDLDSIAAKLIDQIQAMKLKRFQLALELKVNCSF